MLRKMGALSGILLILGALLVPAAHASVPKVVVGEEFGTVT